MTYSPSALTVRSMGDNRLVPSTAFMVQRWLLSPLRWIARSRALKGMRLATDKFWLVSGKEELLAGWSLRGLVKWPASCFGSLRDGLGLVIETEVAGGLGRGATDGPGFELFESQINPSVAARPQGMILMNNGHRRQKWMGGKLFIWSLTASIVSQLGWFTISPQSV